MDLAIQIQNFLKNELKKYSESPEFIELQTIHTILSSASDIYSRERRCSNVPYPPYHLYAQLLGKDLLKMLATRHFYLCDIFPGKIEKSIEYELNNGHMVRRFIMQLYQADMDCYHNLAIEFEHSHDDFEIYDIRSVTIE